MQFYADIETTDTEHTAGIWDIGVVMRLPDGKTEEFSTFCRPQGTISHDTLEWINSQPERKARYEEACKSEVSQAEAMIYLRNWIVRMRLEYNATEPETARFYSWGNFDFPILENANRLAAAEDGWHYREVVDLRSVARFLVTDVRPDTSAHAALADAQALVACHDELNQVVVNLRETVIMAARVAVRETTGPDSCVFCGDKGCSACGKGEAGNGQEEA